MAVFGDILGSCINLAFDAHFLCSSSPRQGRGGGGWESGAKAQGEEQSNSTCCLRGRRARKKEKQGASSQGVSPVAPLKI